MIESIIRGSLIGLTGGLVLVTAVLWPMLVALALGAYLLDKAACWGLDQL